MATISSDEIIVLISLKNKELIFMLQNLQVRVPVGKPWLKNFNHKMFGVHA